ncbi:MAG: YcfA-like protein [Methanosaeta sp. PtaU1.Bin112]|nr:MAG: YcfA-like protein [Methanosaeta sp. PtaU1.Bin112]
MSNRLVPVSRKELIKRLRKLGFSGPFKGKKHQFMFRGDIKLRLPNPHNQDIDSNLLAQILQQAQITHKEWLE